MKSWELNCGPLLLTTVSGIPYLAKIDFMVAIMVSDVVVFSSTMSG